MRSSNKDLVRLYVDDLYNKESFLEFRSTIKTIKKNKELYQFLVSDYYSFETKEKLFKNVFIGQISNEIIDFFLHIIEENKIGEIDDLYEQIASAIVTQENMLDISIFSSDRLSSEEIEKVRDIYEKKYNAKNSRIKTKVDKSLIGGMKIIVGDDVYDNTIKNKLERLKENIKVDISNSDKSLDSLITSEISNIVSNLDKYEYGTVIEVDDEIAKVSGLKECQYGELLEFENGSEAIALSLDRDYISAIFINKSNQVKIGTKVKRSRKPASVPVSEKLLGRVIDPIGNFIDGGEDTEINEYRQIEFSAPGIMDRKAIERPLKTGILAVDSMVPIGRGQRELIIGDRQTGKTAIALQTILNQKNEDVICIYVAIGQKTTTIKKIIATLKDNDMDKKTIVVSSSASDLAAKQYIAPYSGCAIAEYFMYDLKKDVLIVYDDLSKHAISYRTISLLLRRPPGREAYPGDIFYIHSRLLERAAQLNDELGGGSITAIPIVETEEGDISAYIPTNIISITDGQIHLDKEYFNSGQKPAIKASLSVSRIGSSAQASIMKHVSSSIRLIISQYWDLEVFSEFGTDLDEITKEKIDNGKKLMELLKQDRMKQYTLEEEVIILFVGLNNFLKSVELKNVNFYIKDLIEYVKKNYHEFYNHISDVTSSEYEKFDEDLTKIIGFYNQKVQKNG